MALPFLFPIKIVKWSIACQSPNLSLSLEKFNVRFKYQNLVGFVQR